MSASSLILYLDRKIRGDSAFEHAKSVDKLEFFRSSRTGQEIAITAPDEGPLHIWVRAAAIPFLSYLPSMRTSVFGTNANGENVLPNPGRHSNLTSIFGKDDLLDIKPSDKSEADVLFGMLRMI